jgi:hypothetical protein
MKGEKVDYELLLFLQSNPLPRCALISSHFLFNHQINCFQVSEREHSVLEFILELNENKQEALEHN